MLIAIKYNEDDFYTNSYYSKVGGISLAEVNLMEYEILKFLDFDVNIKIDEYTKYMEYLSHYES
jgi:hypothetical protein